MVKAAIFDNSKESLLTPLDWIDASGHFVSLLRKHLWAGGNAEFGGLSAQQLADGWEQHFRCIQGQVDFEEHFAVYLECDIRVCHACMTSPNSFLPDMWHERLFNSILQDTLFRHITTTGPTSLASSSSTSVAAIQARASSGSFWKSSLTGTAQCNGEQKPSHHCMYCGACNHVFCHCPGGSGAKLHKDLAGIWKDTAG